MRICFVGSETVFTSYRHVLLVFFSIYHVISIFIRQRNHPGWQQIRLSGRW